MFTGLLVLEERESSLFGMCNIRDEEGNGLCGKGINVAFQQIPAGQDRFEFARAHALERIKRYRIGREKIILELRDETEQ